MSDPLRRSIDPFGSSTCHRSRDQSKELGSDRINGSGQWSIAQRQGMPSHNGLFATWMRSIKTIDFADLA
ncbi:MULTISPECIES: hypothetical protein [Bradyrhizobium]|uniref:hypothetical protein n=1 Tax=Bradyrhizobium TaxID=374 RepID=UPI001178583D|nr:MULTISPECIES: hypothetical protein [Bradyrhizobium]